MVVRQISTLGTQDYTSLFVLSDPIAAEPFRLRSRLPGDAKVEGVGILWLSRGGSQIERPIKFDATQGSKETDRLWTQLVTPVCVSERFIRLLNENEVSGW